MSSFDRFSLTIPRWLITSTMRRSRPRKLHHYLGRNLILLFNLFALPFFDGVGTRLRQVNTQDAPVAQQTPVEQTEGSGPAIQPAPAVDPTPRQRHKSYSTFFFIPMRFFPIIFVLIGIIVFATNIATAVEEASHG